MKNLLAAFKDYINPESAYNIDQNIARYKTKAINYNFEISHLDELENSIKNTTNKQDQYALKIELLRKLQNLTFTL